MVAAAVYIVMQDKTARRDEGRIIRENEDLVRAIVLRSIRKSARYFEDAMQEGRIGLLEASRDWKEGEGSSLRTFAGPRIEWRVWKFVTRQNHELGFRQSAVSVRASMSQPKTASLEAPIRFESGTDEDASLHDVIAGPVSTPEEQYARKEEREALSREVLRLPFQTVGILIERFMFGTTLAETGVGIGRTKERVRQIEAEALGTLAARMKVAS